MTHLKVTKDSWDGGVLFFQALTMGAFSKRVKNTWASCSLLSKGSWGQLSLFNLNLLEGDNNQTCVQHPASSGDVLSLPTIHLSSQSGPSAIFSIAIAGAGCVDTVKQVHYWRWQVAEWQTQRWDCNRAVLPDGGRLYIVMVALLSD